MNLHIDPAEFVPLIEEAVEAAIRRLQAERATTEPDKILVDKPGAAEILSVSVSTVDRLRNRNGRSGSCGSGSGWPSRMGISHRLTTPFCGHCGVRYDRPPMPPFSLRLRPSSNQPTLVVRLEEGGSVDLQWTYNNDGDYVFVGRG